MSMISKIVYEFGKCLQIPKMFVISKIVCESKKYSQFKKMFAILENVQEFGKKSISGNVCEYKKVHDYKNCPNTTIPNLDERIDRLKPN